MIIEYRTFLTIVSTIFNSLGGRRNFWETVRGDKRDGVLI